MLGRIFKDPAAAMEGKNIYSFFFYYDMLVVSQPNLPEEDRLDCSGLLTDEELAILWETDAYERLREYLPYRIPCCSVIDDVIAKADARLKAGSRGADLRFGHDHVMMALLMAMDIDGFGYLPVAADDFVYYFQTFRSPKGHEPAVCVLYTQEGQVEGCAGEGRIQRRRSQAWQS